MSFCGVCFKKDCDLSCTICKKTFHIVCVDLDEVSVSTVLKNNRNIVYICDLCLDAASCMQKSINFLLNEVLELKANIKEFSNTRKECENNNNLVRDNISNSRLNKSKKNAKQQHTHVPTQTSVDMLSTQQLHRSNASQFPTLADDDIVVVDDAVDSAAHSSSCMLRSRGQSFSCVPGVSSNSQSRHLPQQNEGVNLTDFTVVRRKRQNKRKNAKVVFGDNDVGDLDVVSRKKWVHLSSFKSSVTEEHIVSYVEKSLKISKEHLSCYKLVKKDTPPEEIKYVNFKLGISSQFYDELLKPHLWQSNIRVRPFKFFQKMGPQNVVE